MFLESWREKEEEQEKYKTTIKMVERRYGGFYVPFIFQVSGHKQGK